LSYLPPDPIRVGRAFWPRVRLADYQQRIVYSVWDNVETVLVAGNELGKDFIAAYITLVYFLTRHPCRIVTTSANERHLKVLWGEMGRLIATSAVPLDSRKGGPLTVNYLHIKRAFNGNECPLSYVMGMVAGPNTLDALAGHHIAEVGPGAGFDCCGTYVDYPMPRNLFLGDEASSLLDEYFERVSGWRKRGLIFGNPWPCDNYFRHSVEGKPGTEDRGGDIPRDPRDRLKGYFRKVFNLGAEDSPNVRYARWEATQDREPSNRIVIPGLRTWEKYQEQLRTLDPVRQCIQLHGKFYRGSQNLLFPPDWLNESEELGRGFEEDATPAVATGMGIDPAEGGDDCVWTVVGRKKQRRGVLEQVSEKTPNTDVIPGKTVALGKRWKLDPGQWVFDRGGGGKEHVDRLRGKGYMCRAVGFGEAAGREPDEGKADVMDKIEVLDRRGDAVNRRAEMYLLASRYCDPRGTGGGFAIPREYGDLHRQLALMPKLYDEHGRLYLPPKSRKPGRLAAHQKTLIELLGCSPDEADSFVMAVWADAHPAPVVYVG
jgi:hypothetical protein